MCKIIQTTETIIYNLKGELLIKKKNLRNLLATLMCSILLLSLSTISIFAATTESQTYEINTVRELKKQLKTVDLKERDNPIKQIALAKKTSPRVIENFIQEKNKLAEEKLNNVVIDDILKKTSNGDFYGKTEIDLGDGCEVVVEFEDGEDKDLIALIDNFLSIEAHAATNGEVMWKKYGNRYFTASSRILTGIGSTKLKLENHYKLSSKGIDERYGEAYVTGGFSVGIRGEITARTPVISDAAARTVGSSNVNMYALYDWKWDGQGVTSNQGTTRLSTAIKFVDINKANNQVKVKHTWSYKHL